MNAKAQRRGGAEKDGSWMSSIWTLSGRAKKLPYETNNDGEDLNTADVGLATTNDARTWTKKLNVRPDASGDGTVTVYLKVTDRYAGENYRIEMTKCVPGGCGVDTYPGNLSHRAVALSPIFFTSWKRIFIERDKMFRKGGVLAEDYVPWPDCGGSDPMCICTGGASDPSCCTAKPPATYCNQIVAYEWQNAAAGDQVAVFDEEFTFETLPEIRTVTAVGNPDTGKGLVVVTLDQRLNQPHWKSARTLSTPYQPTFSNHHSAGYGVISGCDPSPNQINASNSCFYQADLRGIEDPYDDAFVEVYAPRDGMSAVPFVAETWFNELNDVWQQDLSGIWFNNLVPYSPVPASLADSEIPEATLPAPHNYYHAIGASSQWRPVQEGKAYRLGLTWAPYDATYLFRGSAEIVASGRSDLEKNRLCQHTAVHEIGHQFWVNGCVSDGHDARPSWCDSAGGCGPGAVVPQKCVMDSSAPLADRWDPSNRFCLEDLFLGDPTCGTPPPDPAQTTIRKQVDPF